MPWSTGWVEVYRYVFLTSTLDGEWSASHPGRFIPRERAPGTHWIGGWVVPRAGLVAVVKSKIPSPCRDSNPRSSSPKPNAIPLSSPDPENYLCFNLLLKRILYGMMTPDDNNGQRCSDNLSLHTIAQRCTIRSCNQKFPDWPPEARTANDTALCH
jgi:hypothetical protein